MMRNPVRGASIEYNDNRLSLFCAQFGRCAVTGLELNPGNIHCHHKLPKKMGGTDRYENLVLLTKEVHELIHATKLETINALLVKTGLDAKQKSKVNGYRHKAGLMGI